MLALVSALLPAHSKLAECSLARDLFDSFDDPHLAISSVRSVFCF